MPKYPRRREIDLAEFRKENPDTTRYGLPLQVAFCRRCVISNQRPNSAVEYEHTRDSKKKTIHFDAEGVCDACRMAEQKQKTIDWSERERRLKELCDRYRSSDGSYDCLVPGSGGKDSFYAAHVLKYKYGMLGDTLVKVLSPWMYAQLAGRFARARLRIVGVTYVLIPVWIAIALLLWGAMLVVGPALLGPRFQAAVGLSFFFLLGGAMSSIYLNIAGLFFFTSKNEWLSIATVCSATIAVVLAIVLTKRFGAAGAAAAYLGAQTAQLVLSWLLSTRVQPMPWHRPWLAVRALGRTRAAAA